MAAAAAALAACAAAAVILHTLVSPLAGQKMLLPAAPCVVYKSAGLQEGQLYDLELLGRRRRGGAARADGGAVRTRRAGGVGGRRCAALPLQRLLRPSAPLRQSLLFGCAGNPHFIQLQLRDPSHHLFSQHSGRCCSTHTSTAGGVQEKKIAPTLAKFTNPFLCSQPFAAAPRRSDNASSALCP